MLIGGLSAGALTGCGPGSSSKAPITGESVYTNNYHVPGVGYYHAPFRAWFSLPYNHFDPSTRRYFYGGQWGALPFQTFTNVSSPTADVARQAETKRTDVARGGFGRTSRWHGIHS
jgi:hypothetical protein